VRSTFSSKNAGQHGAGAIRLYRAKSERSYSGALRSISGIGSVTDYLTNQASWINFLFARDSLESTWLSFLAKQHA
jgi:hypothetical protein